MSFEAFDTKRIDEYTEQARAAWGTTSAYREYEERSRGRSREAQQGVDIALMDIFREFGALRGEAADTESAIAVARKLQDHITANYYTCTDAILSSLGTMYAAGGDFTANIDKAGGEGTAAFAREVIEAYLRSRR